MTIASRNGRLSGFCVVALCLCLFAVGDAGAVRVMSWNALNYPGSTGSARSPHFQAVIEAAAPDILVCQELTGLSGANTFRNSVLLQANPAGWVMAPFTDGSGSDNALYYRTGQWTVVSYGAVSAYPREIDWYQMRRNNGATGVGADFVIYVGHLKASDTTSDREYRRQAAENVRAHAATWPAGTHFVVAGDFNLYSASEPAWSTFTGAAPSEDGRLYDPVNFAGSWHDNAGYAYVHTQSTRTTNLGDGGSTGGGDDRFDFLLINDDLTDGSGWEYVTNTYTTFGQDGQHFNNAINAPPTNAAVGQSLADNLHAASDHLPIIVEFSEPAHMALTPSAMNYGDVLLGSPTDLPLGIFNMAGVPGGDLTWFGGTSAGLAFPANTSNGVVAASDSQVVNMSLLAETEGAYSGSIFLFTNSPGQETVVLPVAAHVVSASVPSLDGLAQVLADTLDFGEHAEGEFASAPFSVHNLGFDADQAELRVSGAAFTGADAARFSLVGSLPQTVNAVALELQVAFDDVGVAESTVYTAQLTLTCSDDPGVAGASGRADLVLDLVATVSGGGTPAPSPSLLATRMYAPTPSPFNPATEIRFDLERDARVRIDVMDIRGRLVATLVDGGYPAGVHAEVWRGEDHAGRPVASGVYLFRMRAGHVVQVQRGVLVR